MVTSRLHVQGHFLLCLNYQVLADQAISDPCSPEMHHIK